MPSCSLSFHLAIVGTFPFRRGGIPIARGIPQVWGIPIARGIPVARGLPVARLAKIVLFCQRALGNAYFLELVLLMVLLAMCVSSLLWAFTSFIKVAASGRHSLMAFKAF